VSTETIPLDEYKNLQRQNEKLRKDYAQLLQAHLANEEVKSGMERIERGLDAFFGAEVEHGSLDDANEFKTTVAELRTRRVTDKQAAAAQKQIAEVLAQADVDWSDNRLETTRTLWDSGSYDQAVASARAALTSPSSEEMNARVEAEIRRRMGEVGKVDTGDGGGSDYTPTIPADVLKKKLQDRNFVRQHGKQVWEDIKSGKLKV
jgi:hypothetical protein